MTSDVGIVATPRAHETTAPSLEQQHPSLNLKLSAAAPTSAGSPNTAHVAHAATDTASPGQHQHRHGRLRRVHLVPTDFSKTINRTHQSLFEDIVFDEGGLGSAESLGGAETLKATVMPAGVPRALWLCGAACSSLGEAP